MSISTSWGSRAPRAIRCNTPCPFIFSDPEIVRGIIRYTLKEIQPNGSIPYGLVGSGVPMPVIFRPSDQEMWLLWLASEYENIASHRSIQNAFALAADLLGQLSRNVANHDIIVPVSV